MKILLAEGRSDVRSALRLFLEQDVMDVTIVEAAKIRDLLKQVSVWCPDLILIDLELPEMKAAEIMAQLRDLCPDTHIIATSGRAELRKKALEVGADAFINKSDSIEQMMNTIKATIK